MQQGITEKSESNFQIDWTGLDGIWRASNMTVSQAVNKIRQEFPHLLSTHFLKQVWVILNSKNTKVLAKWIIMPPTNLLKQKAARFYVILANNSKTIKASKTRETYLLNNSTLYSISFSAIPNICFIITWIIETHPKARKTK